MPSDHERVADRARLARELHDGIAQDLVGIGYSLDLLLGNPEASTEARSQLRTLRFTVTELIDKVRKEIYFLRQPSTFSLSQDIQKSAEELFSEAELTLHIDEIDMHGDPEMAYEILRIAQEILRNTAAHARASNVDVSLHASSDGIELCISDDGVGGAIESNIQYGIQSILDRAKAIGGSIEIKSDSNGTKISLRAPREDHAVQ